MRNENCDRKSKCDFEELKPLIDKIVEVLPELTDTIIKELPRMVSREIKCSECPFYKNTWGYIPRPQGEWEESHIFSCGKILRMRMDVIEHKCKHCGRWSIKWVRTIPDNFCPNCGADMRGNNDE